MTAGYFSARAVGGIWGHCVMLHPVFSYVERRWSTGSYAAGGPVNRLLLSFLGTNKRRHREARRPASASSPAIASELRARSSVFIELLPHGRLLPGSRRTHLHHLSHHNEAHRDVEPAQSMFRFRAQIPRHLTNRVAPVGIMITYWFISRPLRLEHLVELMCRLRIDLAMSSRSSPSCLI